MKQSDHEDELLLEEAEPERKSTIQRCIKEIDPENCKIKRRLVARLTDIFRDATKVREINASDNIDTISDITTLTVNTYTLESSSSSYQ